MSRGGRGGGRGRGGGSRGKARIAGQDMNWDYDPDISAPSEPQQMFPVGQRRRCVITIRRIVGSHDALEHG